MFSASTTGNGSLLVVPLLFLVTSFHSPRDFLPLSSCSPTARSSGRELHVLQTVYHGAVDPYPLDDPGARVHKRRRRRGPG